MSRGVHLICKGRENLEDATFEYNGLGLPYHIHSDNCSTLIGFALHIAIREQANDQLFNSNRFCKHANRRAVPY